MNAGYVEKVCMPPYLPQSAKPFTSFFCAMIAALTLRTLDPFGTGKLVLFQVTYDKAWLILMSRKLQLTVEIGLASLRVVPLPSAWRLRRCVRRLLFEA